MRRAPALAVLALVAVIAAACSGGSSSKSSATTTTAAAAAATTTTTAAVDTSSAAPTSSSSPGAPSTTAPATTTTAVVAPPTDACFLLTGPEASALVGVTVLGNSSTSGSTTTCTYTGKAHVTLVVTNFASSAAAHNQLAQLAKGKSATAPVAGIGDEGVAYPGGLTVRVAHVLATITSSPAPVYAALLTAARAVVGRL